MADGNETPFLAIKIVMMPNDVNPFGTVFGGVLLSYIDQAGAVGAQYAIRSRGWPDHPLVTVAMDRVEFHEPVLVGDVVCFWTTVERIGRTSITMHVVVTTERGPADEPNIQDAASPKLVHESLRGRKLTEAQITMVAVDLMGSTRRPVPIRGE